MKNMISVNEALEIVLKKCRPLKKEIISLDQALGRVLSSPALAELTQPPQDMSAIEALGRMLTRLELMYHRRSLTPMTFGAFSRRLDKTCRGLVQIGCRPLAMD